MIDTPAITDIDADVLLIRHGFSEFNYRHLILKKDGGKDGQPFQELKGDPSVIDADLHPIGVHQALVNAPKLLDLNITRVFVSPMRRAIQTAIHMFKGHPNGQ
jgi:broad specificity phosphatase PhoE